MSSHLHLPAASTMTGALTREEATALIRQVSRLLNRQLSSVCQVNGLKSTGVKAELQQRINKLIQEALNANDVVGFHQIRQSVANAAMASTSATSSAARLNHAHSHPISIPPLPATMSYSSPNYPRDGRTGFANGNSNGYSNGHRPAVPYGQTTRMTFKPSPFYQIETSISDVRTCEAMSQHRNSITIPLKLNDIPALQKCVDDKSYRVLVFCATDTTGAQDIAFPHQSELKVNGGEIKANLRGLKNKPGSTRPVDITSALRLRPNYANNLDFTYALTSKKFYLVLNLCKVSTVEELVERIRIGNKIPKESVIRELNKIAQDPDIVATSQNLSLRCPLTYMRLDLPCRGLSCTHIQCFDATSYLQLQEQGPQWVCPHCLKPVPFEQLAVDGYVMDILEKTSKSLETVTIEPDGHWLTKDTNDERNSQSQTNGTTLRGEDDDDDELEISEVSIVGGRRFDTPKNPTPSTSTPVSTHRDSASLGPRGTGSISAKRPAAPVIDLTLSSDDEDDEPIRRPAKRQNTNTNGYSGASNHLDFMSEESLGFRS